MGIAEQERERRNDKDNNKVVQKYGEIYAYQGREDIKADDEDEAKIVNIRNVRKAKPRREKYKKMIQSFPNDYWKVLDFKIKFLNRGLWLDSNPPNPSIVQ